MYRNIHLAQVNTYVQHVLRERQQLSFPDNYRIAGEAVARLSLRKCVFTASSYGTSWQF